MTRDGSARPSALQDRVDALAADAARVGVAASFWAEVALPVALLPLLAGGRGRPTDVAAFFLLVGANGTALVAGRGYASAGDGSD